VTGTGKHPTSDLEVIKEKLEFLDIFAEVVNANQNKISVLLHFDRTNFTFFSGGGAIFVTKAVRNEFSKNAI